MVTDTVHARESEVALSRADYLRFLIPSAIGAGLMLVPFRFGDTFNIGLGIIADFLRARVGSILPGLATLVIVLSAIATIATGVVRRRLDTETLANPILSMFLMGPTILVARVVGAITASMVLFQWGPVWLISDTTGRVILNELIPVIMVIFVVAPLLLPLVTDFGLMEFLDRKSVV